MAYEIVFMPAMMLMGVQLRTTFKNNECFKQIPAFWQQQNPAKLFAQIPNKISPNVVVGLYTDYSPNFSVTDGDYSFVIGCPVENKKDSPMGLVIKEIPAATYAVFTAHGPFATAVGAMWAEIWQAKELERTFTNDFEWYDAQSTNDEKSFVKIYIAIR